AVKDLVGEAFDRIGSGRIENDDFNRLVLRAQLGSREVTILRAYAKYLRQVGSTFSDAYIERALTGNPSIARKLVELLVARLNPGRGDARDAQVELLLKWIDTALDQVPNLDEDRILRQFLGVIKATERTN